MGNIIPLFLSSFALILASMAIFVVIFTGKDAKRFHRHKHRHPPLKLRILFHHKIKHSFMSSINSIVLSDANPHPGLVQVVDDAGNVYSGTLSNPVITLADPSQDTLIIDPNTPNTVDVQELTPQGGTTAVVKMDFVSQGNSTPAAGSTAQAIPDGTVFPALAVNVTMINRVTASLKLQVTF